MYTKRISIICTLIICLGVLLAVTLLPPRDVVKMTFSEKIKAGVPATIVINGDSIGGTDAKGEWCRTLQDELNETYGCTTKIENISKPGNSTFAGIVSLEQYITNPGNSADLVILCYGQNDSDEESFAIEYEALIRNTIQANPNAQIVAILESSQKTYTSKINTIINLCNYYGIPYADMIEAFNSSGYAYEELSDDGVHPNELGKSIYAQELYTVISNNLLSKKSFWDFKGERPKKRTALSEASEKYRNCRYISAENMQIKNGNISVDIPECSIIGLDIMFKKGAHGIKLNISNQDYDMDYSWTYDFSQRHIYKVLDGHYDPGNMSLTFEKAEDARDILGVIYFEWDGD